MVAKALRIWGIEATVRKAKRERKLWNLIWPDEVRLELKSRSGDSNGVKLLDNEKMDEIENEGKHEM